jgi:hypothetical protein
MAGVRGQASAKPGQVMNPVPGKDAAMTADSLLAEFDAPEMAAPAAAPSADSLLAEFDGAEAPVEQDPNAPIPEDQFAPDPGFLEANVDQFSNLGDRVRAGLAANDTEKLAFLQKQYGPKNAVMKNGELYFRKDPKAKLKRFDPDQMEMVADFLDFSREAVVEGAMLPGEVGGAIMGAPYAGVGAIPGAIAGRVASVPMANALANSVAQRAGIPQDPSRNQRMENTVGMVAETVLPVVGGKIVKEIAKRIPGTMAYKAALQSGQREIVALSAQSKEVLKAADDLAAEGINLNLMQQQIHSTSPQILKKVASVEKMPAFVQKQQEFAEGYGAALENTVNEMKRAANPSGARVSSESITDAVKLADRLEGERIGMYKAKALAKTKNAPAPLPQSANQIAEDAMRQMGFTPKVSRKEVLVRPGSLEGAASRGIEERKMIEKTIWSPPKDMEEVAGTFGLDAPQARVMTNALKKYSDTMSASGGQARVTEVEALIDYLGPITQKLRGTNGGRIITQITNQLRTHRREMIAAGLPDTDKQLFNQAMDEFGLKREVMNELSGVLDNEVSAKAIVQHFFTGKSAIKRVNALKTIVGTDSPQWGALKEEFLNQVLLDGASSKSATGFDSAGVLKTIKNKYGDDFVSEVLDQGTGPNSTTLKNLLTVGERIEASQRGLKIDNLSEQQKKAQVESLFGFLYNSSYRMVNGAAKMLGLAGDKEAVLMEILNREGVEKYLSSYKESAKKQKIASVIEPMLQNYNAARAADTRVGATLRAGEDVLKRGSRGFIREGLNE